MELKDLLDLFDVRAENNPRNAVCVMTFSRTDKGRVLVVIAPGTGEVCAAIEDALRNCGVSV